MHNFKTLLLLAFLFFISCSEEKKEEKTNLFVTERNKDFLQIEEADLKVDSSFSYSETFGKYITGYNTYILQAIDKVQAKFPDGGGYFIGISAIPTESPIGYNLNFLNRELLNAPRATSYCSGSSYTVFIEALNLILADSTLSDKQLELLRMQEPDGDRRNDGVKFWGNWNADGYGSYDALVSYSGIGEKIKPKEAMPGDFMNISWKSGIGHSVIFLGWLKIEKTPFLAYWSSQKSTNGLGLDTVKIDKINNISLVRLTKPEKILTFEPNFKITHTKGDTIRFE